MGAGHARERVALANRQSCPAVSQRRWFFRCSVLRIGDAVQWWCLPGPLKPSMAAVSLALLGQTVPSRHHHCPAHWVASPPRVTTPPDLPGREAWNLPRSTGIGWARPGPSLARDGQSRAYRDVLVACPGRAHPIPVRALWREKSLGSCRELRSLSRAGPAPTSPAPTSLPSPERYPAAPPWCRRSARTNRWHA